MAISVENIANDVASATVASPSKVLYPILSEIMPFASPCPSNSPVTRGTRAAVTVPCFAILYTASASSLGLTVRTYRLVSHALGPFWFRSCHGFFSDFTYNPVLVVLANIDLFSLILSHSGNARRIPIYLVKPKLTRASLPVYQTFVIHPCWNTIC